jgi:uncharacterized protein (DUF1015 family)
MSPTVAPFRGLRYNPKKISDLSKVVAPPYDVIDEKYQKILYDRNPNNVIRLILTREDDAAKQGMTKYEVAHKYLEEWKKQEVLIRDVTPQIYLYHQTYHLEDGRELTRKGFIALRKLESFEEGRIRPHEYTFAGPKADRLNLIKSTAANLSCIFGIYRDPLREVSELFSAFREKPIVEIVTDDQNSHRLWAISDPQLFSDLNELMESKVVLIADGHHRYETALAYRDFMRSQVKEVKGDELFNYVMMYFCATEDEGLIILPTHRVITVPVPASWEESLEKLRPHFDVTEYSKDEKEKAVSHLHELSTKHHAFLICLKGGGLAVLSTEEARLSQIKELQNLHPAVRGLDVNILHQYLLPHVFKVHVEESAPGKILYVKEASEAFQQVLEGNATLAFILNPTKMSQVEAICDIGERMPHKSTFFYPKLLSGLVFNPIDLEDRIKPLDI